MSEIQEYLEGENLERVSRCIFRVIDKENTGKIRIKDLKEKMEEFKIVDTDEPLTEQEIKKTLERLDQDNSEFIDFDEFKDFIKILIASFT